jgi:RHS repeat-associated protein
MAVGTWVPNRLPCGHSVRHHLPRAIFTITDAFGAAQTTAPPSDPYGYPVPSGTVGTDPNPYQFGGQAGYYTDPNSFGLVLCGQRWYSPLFGRWLSRDPIGYAGGQNLYAYCDDNPVRGIDPGGTDAGGYARPAFAER